MTVCCFQLHGDTHAKKREESIFELLLSNIESDIY